MQGAGLYVRATGNIGVSSGQHFAAQLRISFRLPVPLQKGQHHPVDLEGNSLAGGPRIDRGDDFLLLSSTP
jgi:hypothetical protein